MDPTSRILGWVFLAALVFLVQRGTLGAYLSLLGL